jgi:hypothetical protein
LRHTANHSTIDGLMSILSMSYSNRMDRKHPPPSASGLKGPSAHA